MTSNVKPDNDVSLNFHKKNDFEIVGSNEYGLSLAKKIKEKKLEKDESNIEP